MFDELQLDAEWSLNVGNWLWLSGSTFVKEHVPWFCPVEVGKKIDPSGEYVRYAERGNLLILQECSTVLFGGC